ncbi:VOC family protein [Paenibacillus roseipurpureus]|uniref:Glyoxalase/bleomycin resistance/extradiol dioxygenase family protein n=1 Tax=Paenibacillus roseopurpureus TaxID=2918901 RepID=A0AA96LQD2_9BACL|nr:VOC family protein [Paenibacillus sp. MBLB1832]WNR45387.1 glyoxalase/bleomycin resistance/extradiol dioxygenase family protein [Paenibacillus sp. MBLB1832]
MALTSAFTSFNLPVKNVEQSKDFFTGLGFEFNPQFSQKDKSESIVIGANLQVMLISQEFFNTLTQKETVDTDKYAQMTIALAFESREKVDEIVNTAVSLGGKIHEDPENYGFMYHWGFVDLDGHMWAINYINTDAAQG